MDLGLPFRVVASDKNDVTDLLLGLILEDSELCDIACTFVTLRQRSWVQQESSVSGYERALRGAAAAEWTSSRSKRASGGG
jgi:hypothetical protein